MNNKIGDNNPPSHIEFTLETYQALNDWLTDHPVILTEEDARQGKLLKDRAALCLADLEQERDGKVRPLNEQVKSINDTYRGPKDQLTTIAATLTTRITDYAKTEALKREEVARQARKAEEEAYRKAQEAFAAEALAKEEAAEGVVVDIGGAASNRIQAVKDFQKAERKAAQAERDQRVKIGGGFRRALSLREKETLVVANPQAAVDATGWTADMMECLLKAARAYRKLHGNLPPGIISIKEDSI